MIILVKLTMFITHLPLAVFFYFRGGKYNLPGLSRMQILLGFVICGVVATSQFFNPPQAEGSLMENFAVDTVAISMANTVTASPPGIVGSIHYNPAGLSLLPDGNFFNLGLTVPYSKTTQKFTANPDFKGFHDLYGNRIEDPVAGTEGHPAGFGYSPLTGEATQGPDFSVAPSGLGISQRKPGSKWTFAFGSVYAPVGGGMIYPDPNDPMRFSSKQSYIQNLVYAAPAVSYQASKTLSLGASFGLSQLAFGTAMDMRSPNVLVNLTKILGDATYNMNISFLDSVMPMPLFAGGMGPYEQAGSVALNMVDNMSPSYNLGLLWEPFDWFSFGASYNSSTKTNLEGTYKFKYSEQWQKMQAFSGKTVNGQIIALALDTPYEAVAVQKGKAKLDMELPQMAAIGIKLKPLKRLALLADLHWANWSLWQKMTPEFDQKIQFLQLAKFMTNNKSAYKMEIDTKLQDTLNWSVGMEYQMLDWLMLRAGYENRKTSCSDEYFGAGAALADINFYGAGLGIKLENDINIDLALGYLLSPTYISKSNSSKALNTEELGVSAAPYPGLDYQTDFATVLASAKITTPLSNITRILPNAINSCAPCRSTLATMTRLSHNVINVMGGKGWVPAPKKGSLISDKSVILPATSTTANVIVPDKVDSSAAIVDDLQIQGQSYYTEDSE